MNNTYGKLEYSISKEKDAKSSLNVTALIDGAQSFVKLQSVANERVLKRVISGIIRSDSDAEQLQFLIQDAQ